MTRSLTMFVALLLVAAACGSNSGEGATQSTGDQSAPTQAATAQPAADDGGSDDTPPAGDDRSDAEGSGPSTASVTLGDETYTFSTEAAPIAQCLTDLYGIFSIQLPGDDGGIQISILHEDTDPAEVGQVNAVRISVGDEDWVADESDMMFELQPELLQPGMSQVDSIEIDGRTVRGTATFFRELSLFAGEVETLTGTFEATCGEERLS